MLDIEKFADTGQLFDNHYKLIRPLNTEGGTADVWLALDTTTVSDKGALDRAPYLDDVKLSEVGLLVAIKIYKPKNALDIEGERRFREEFVIDEQTLETINKWGSACDDLHTDLHECLGHGSGRLLPGVDPDAQSGSGTGKGAVGGLHQQPEDLGSGGSHVRGRS